MCIKDRDHGCSIVSVFCLGLHSQVCQWEFIQVFLQLLKMDND